MHATESRTPRESACCAQGEKRPETVARAAGETVPNRPLCLDASLRAGKRVGKSALTEAFFGDQTP
jgi:hypothetical protein